LTPYDTVIAAYTFFAALPKATDYESGSNCGRCVKIKCSCDQKQFTGACQPGGKETIDAVFLGRNPLLYHKFDNVIFRSGNLCSLCSPGNQDCQKIIHFKFFHQKGSNFYIFNYRTLIVDFDLFDEKLKKK